MKKILMLFSEAVLLIVFLTSCVTSPTVITDDDVTLYQTGEGATKKVTAEVETTLGKMTFELYPEIAPKCVESFTTLANEGYYNGTKISYIENDWCLCGSDKEDYSEGKTIYSEQFSEKASDNLFHFTGSISMYTDSDKTEYKYDSRFIITGTDKVSEKTIETMPDYRIWANKVINTYKELGGAPSLDFSKYPVFGQMISGKNTLQAIMNAETKNDTAEPLEEITITKITITE